LTSPSRSGFRRFGSQKKRCSTGPKMKAGCPNCSSIIDALNATAVHAAQLGLQWGDIDWEKQKIYVRRAWTRGKIGRPKSKASKAPVPLHALLATFLREWKSNTLYSKPDDWVFASERLDGKQPRVPNMLVEDHLRPAAVKAGVPELVSGQKVRFGFHNLRHSLASFLVDSGTDPKTVQDLLRQADVQTTLKFYAHSKHATKLAAQGQMLEAILQRPVSEAIN